jgi:hypothetical protein
MDLKFVDQVIKGSLLLASICFILEGLLVNLPFGIGVFAGAFWGCINLFLLRHLLQNWLIIDSYNSVKLYTLLGLKFPLLYLLGYGLLQLFPTLSLILGFSTILVVIFLNGLNMLINQNSQI